MISLVKKYFNWLQKDNPVGNVTMFPELSEDYETSLKGVYIIGDLTGVPLLKFTAANGSNIVRKFSAMKEAISYKKKFDSIQDKIVKNSDDNVYDLIIVGGGPAGISAALEAQKRGLSYIVLEATDRMFNTIKDFPKGKEMFYEPENMVDDSDLTMKGKTKEDLLKHFNTIIKDIDLNVIYNQKVENIQNETGGINTVFTQDQIKYRGQKVLLAIGKTGNHRKLGVKGEELSHVFYKLYDPADYKNKNILVVGGGDSALETALLLEQAGNNVTLSYRKDEITRPKPANINSFNALVKKGKITQILSSNIKEIRENEVDIEKEGEISNYKADVVFIKAGNQLPYEFFKRCGIRLENEKTSITWWWLAFSLAFANIIYFGKASYALADVSSWSLFLQSIFDGSFYVVANKFLAWASIPVLFLSGCVVGVDFIFNWRKYLKTKWHFIKYIYFTCVIILTLTAFIYNKYLGVNLYGYDPYFWYSFLYTITILLFGIRRVIVAKKTYVTKQTITVFLIQALPLFIIPNFVLPYMNDVGLLSPWVIQNIFLGGEWWRFVGFILAWPLFIWNILTDQPSLFWLFTGLIQTFVIIPFIVLKWGKGAYCSWICSCGAMAETLGDEYRNLAPHGEKAKKWENLGQVILLSIFFVTFMKILGWVPQFSQTLSPINEILVNGYALLVDTMLAGAIGVGVYFFYSGRMWCRFACPLAALMHIYNRFSQWSILADKKKCISCGLCTKVCHMGIDVMNYANKGKPVTDVECVNCSACVNVCPTGVLSFGKYRKLWRKK